VNKKAVLFAYLNAEDLRKESEGISENYKYMETFHRIYHLLAIKRIELLI